jgi:membrane-associated phospholipid phosphatase
MPLLFDLILTVAAGVAAGLFAWHAGRPALASARKVGETVGQHRSLRRALRSRLDPEVATGLALTLALVVVIGGGLVLGVLAFLVRSNRHLHGLDNGVAKWGNEHATAFSTHGLTAITQLGAIVPVVVALCVVLALTETIVQRSVWVIPFVVAVVGGEEVLTTAVKDLAHRVRPAFNPAAASLGPSFPSGHSATAAAFYACAALLIGRHRGRMTRAVLAGVAVGIAVAVAASRVLLDVHWLTDVIGGLALGWAWFCVCAIAFGGRLLRFGAGAEVAAQAAKQSDRTNRSRRGSYARWTHRPASAGGASGATASRSRCSPSSR